MDQREIAALRKINQDLKEYYEDRELFKEAVLGFFNTLVEEQEYGWEAYKQKENNEKLSRLDIACHHLAANVDMIYDYAESPIEKLFLCNFLFISLRFSPFTLTITTPIVADVFPAKMSALHQRNLDLRRDTRKNKYGPDLWHVAEMFKILEELELAAYSIIPKHLDAIGRDLRCHNESCVKGR